VLFRVDYRFDRLWLLIDPTVVTDLPEDAPKEVIELTASFVRERRAGRHNRAANAILDGWISLIVGKGRAFGSEPSAYPTASTPILKSCAPVASAENKRTMTANPDHSASLATLFIRSPAALRI